MESFYKNLKTELVDIFPYENRKKVERSLLEYIEVFYNKKRLYSSLSFQSPEEFEKNIKEVNFINC